MTADSTTRSATQGIDPEPARPSDLRPRLVAEIMGTALLVAAGIGAGVFSFTFAGPGALDVGIGILGVAFAAGLAITVAAYAFGPISGGHFNPAVTVGLAAAGRFGWREVVPYVGAQIVGAVAGALLVAAIAASSPTALRDARAAGFAANGFGEHSPGGFGVGGAILVELVFTAALVWIILCTTAKVGAVGFAPLAVGLSVVLMCLVAVPVDGTSLNPARSFAAAIFGQPWAWEQLWLFVVFPLAGGLIAGASCRALFGARFTEPDQT